jgi:flagellar basal-body rod modification protein FlgD
MSTVSSTSSTSSLTQTDYLNLLSKQLTNQDPLNPQSDTDFIAQLAQFSALQETQTIATKVTAMKTNQEISEGSGLIGKTVTITDSESNTTQGTVSSVNVDSDTVNVVIDNTDYPISEVTGVQNPTSD